MSIQSIDDSNFEEQVLNSKGCVLVDFWAEWCGPCRALAPILEKVSDDMDGRAKVLKLNISENPNSPAKFSVKSIPTIILFKDGEEVEQLVGNQPKDTIVELIKKHLD